ncbi:hypothetical protein CFOL_v3_07066, partial [Cephalotus follicularis]
EVEDKVSEIFKLIKTKGKAKKGGISNAQKEAELVKFVEDIHKQYQSLFVQYNHLKEESEKKAHSRKGEGSYSSSSSSSDLDSGYYSLEEVETDNINLNDEHHNATNNIKEGLKSENLDIGDLEHKLASMSQEKEAIHLQYMAALSKIQEAEIVKKNLRSEVDESKRELAALVKKHESHRSRMSARTKELEGQLTGMKIELKSLHNQKKNLEAKIESKAAETKQLTDKNKVLHTRNLELELISKEKGHEASNLQKKLKENESNLTRRSEELMAQLSTLKVEVESLHAQKGNLEGSLAWKKSEATAQVKGLMNQVNAMQQELDCLRRQKSELELQMGIKTKELSENLIQISNLHLEVNSLRDQKGELEGSMVYKKNEAWAQVKYLVNQVNVLQQELDSLRSQKIKLEPQPNENLKRESSESQTKIEAENFELSHTIADPEAIQIQHNDTINKFSEERTEVKQLSVGSRVVNPQVAERKMEELAEDFLKKSEDNIRILYQRILVAEQIHNENKESYRRTKERLQQDNKLLGEKVASYETELRKLRDTLDIGNNTFAGLDLAVRKFEGNGGEFLNRITKISNEILFTRNWVRGANDEIKQLRHKVDCLVAQLEDKEEQEFLLREKVWKLEAKLGKEGGEKLNLMISVSQLEKEVGELERKMNEKEERLLSLGEEKREAIRQLCVLIDYHCSRFNHLKYMISKMNVRRRQ